MEISTIEDAARLYKRIEAAVEAKEAEFAKVLAPYKEKMGQLETFMLSILNTNKVSSMNVPDVAEVKIVPKRTFSSGDWDKTYTYIVVNNCPELLQKRVHEENMQHWIDTHNGEIPPGVNVVTKNVLKLYKPK